MNEIGDQKVAIELRRCRQRRQCCIRQSRGVLQNRPQRKLARDLPIPFCPDDVVIEDGGAAVRVAQPREQVGVVDA